MLRLRCYIGDREIFSTNANDVQLVNMISEFMEFAEGGTKDAKQLNTGHRVILEWTSDEPKQESRL